MTSREYLSVLPGGRGNIRSILIGVLAGIIVCMVMLLVFAWVLSAQNLPQPMIDPMASVSVSLAGLVAGFICTRLTRSNGLLYGLATGGALSIILLIAGLSLSGAGVGIPGLFKVIFILLCSAIGGIIGVNSKPSKARKSKSRKKK